MSERVSSSDLQLLQAAHAELTSAQNVVGFAQAHIARTYKLKDGDTIGVDGTIQRVDLKVQGGEIEAAVPA